jgi:hypothetical protein
MHYISTMQFGLSFHQIWEFYTIWGIIHNHTTEFQQAKVL